MEIRTVVFVCAPGFYSRSLSPLAEHQVVKSLSDFAYRLLWKCLTA